MSEESGADLVADADGQQALDGLQAEPDEQQPHRPQFDDRNQEVDNQCADAVARIQQQVGAHDAGNRARCPYQRGLRCRVNGEVGQRGQDAGSQVEHQVLDVAEGVFDVVAEHPQEQHIADEVHEAAVDEHTRQQRAPGRHRRGDADSARGAQSQGLESLAGG